MKRKIIYYCNNIEVKQADIIELFDGDLRHQVIALVDTQDKIEKSGAGQFGVFTTPIEDSEFLNFINEEIIRDDSSNFISRGNISSYHPLSSFINAIDTE